MHMAPGRSAEDGAQLLAQNCVFYRPGPQARSGIWAGYDKRRNRSTPSHSSTSVGAQFAFEFSGRSAAKRALNALRADVIRCLGTHRGEGFLRRRSMLQVPRIGTARPLAWSEYFRERYGDDIVSVDRTRYVWTRIGRFLIRTSAFRERSMPATRPLVRLAKTATRVVR